MILRKKIKYGIKMLSKFDLVRTSVKKVSNRNLP